MALFKRRIKSALYIDYENVPINPDRIANVVAWLEDGMFDAARSLRRFDIRRVYWNSQANRHRAAYEAKGFEVILIEKYAGLKNGADIRIAMDMIEAALKRRAIDEFILISKDSDFVPVIQRLGEKDRRTIMMVEEQQPAIYTAYDLHADGVIPHRALVGEAFSYARPKRGLIDKLGLGGRKSKPTVTAKQVAAKQNGLNGKSPDPAAPPAAPSLKAPKPATETPMLPSRKELIEQAVAAFVKVASRNPGKLTGKHMILKQLHAIKGFTNTGSSPYLGFKSYELLAKEVARRDPRITIQADKLGGITVVYVPADGAESMSASSPAAPIATEQPA